MRSLRYTVIEINRLYICALRTESNSGQNFFNIIRYRIDVGAVTVPSFERDRIEVHKLSIESGGL